MTVRHRLVPIFLAAAGLAALTAGRVSAQRSEFPVFSTSDVLTFRAIGPARQCGRILHIAVPNGRPYTFYLAPSSGGLWKTENNGTTFTSILPRQSNVPIGHIAIAPSNPDIIWVGTGDPASGRIPLRGFGVMKSTDGGKNWADMGLEATRHIGRIAIDPRNPDVVYVAAVGYHFTFNPERGLYKTTDGGKTWKKAFFVSDKVGVADVQLNPANPDIVFLATYDKRRVPWNFDEGGPEGAVYRSSDAGRTWRRLGGGLPSGKIARIGLAIHPRKPSIVYATVDNQNPVPAAKDAPAKPAAGGSGALRERAIGGEVYRSEDGGSTWRKMNSLQDPVGGGKWYGQIYVDPNDDRIIYVPSTSLNRSLDGGKTWGKAGRENIAARVHVDYHALWIDPANSNHLLLGHDGGLAASYDFGKTWDAFDTLPLAQFYAVGVDMERPYNIYGGLQDNGSIKVRSNGPGGRVTGEDFTSVGGGDGQFNVVDPTDSRWLFNASQNGAFQRLDQRTGVGRSIRPVRGKDKPPFRFNWTAPIVLSPHNSRILYVGAQVVLRSLDRGDSWQEISPDLTTFDPVKHKGNIEYGTITSISESPLTPGLLWVGTDDGRVQWTKNGGATWTDVTGNVAAAGGPEKHYVTRVAASSFKEGTAFAVKAGFPYDDYRPYAFRTDDYGATWSPITGDLPEGTVYVLVEDRKNPNLLFVGTERSVCFTLDGGRAWKPLADGIPDRALVHDLLIHPRDNDLVAASHGRGLFVMDIGPLQEMTESVISQDAALFSIEPKVQWTLRRSGLGDVEGDRIFNAPNESAGVCITYYLRSGSEAKARITITTPYGEEVARLEGPSGAGLNRVIWDMRLAAPGQPAGPAPGAPQGRSFGARFVPPGDYVVTLEAGGGTISKRAAILPPPGPDEPLR